MSEKSFGDKLVKVKFLKNVGHWTEGQEAEVTAEQAQAMCTVRKKHNGYELVDHRTAISIEELEKLKAMPFDKSQLTTDELKALGGKNVVVIPKEELEKPFAASFKVSKDPAEAASDVLTAELNEKNSSAPKKGKANAHP